MIITENNVNYKLKRHLDAFWITPVKWFLDINEIKSVDFEFKHWVMCECMFCCPEIAVDLKKTQNISFDFMPDNRHKNKLTPSWEKRDPSFLFHFLLLFHILVHCFYSIFFCTYLNNEIRAKSLFPRTQKDCIFSFLNRGRGGTGRIEEGGFFTSFTNRQTDGDRETDRRSKSREGGGSAG